LGDLGPALDRGRADSDAPWVAAGAGRVDRLERFLDGRGGLRPQAYLHRPNPADVGWLLNHDADPNVGPYQGCGALHLAAAFGALESVRLLIAVGADIDQANDFNGDNALGWAERSPRRADPGDMERPGGHVAVSPARRSNASSMPRWISTTALSGDGPSLSSGMAKLR